MPQATLTAPRPGGLNEQTPPAHRQPAARWLPQALERGTEWNAEQPWSFPRIAITAALGQLLVGAQPRSVPLLFEAEGASRWSEGADSGGVPADSRRSMAVSSGVPGAAW